MLCLSAQADSVIVEVGDVVALTNYMAKLSNGSTITLKPGVYDLSSVHETVASWAYCHLKASKHLLIKGQNEKHWSEKTPEEETILRGDGTASILYPHGGGGRQVSVWHITFENGYRPGKAPGDVYINTFGGGAISSAQTEQFVHSQGKGFATNCVFRSCSSAYNGGATGRFNAFDCLYTNNTSEANGGAAHSFCGTNGGQIYNTNRFDKCVFVDNEAQGSAGKGGAIYGEYIDSLAGCTFIGNKAMDLGGAVCADTPMSLVTDCVFSNNTSAGSSGGGIRSTYATARISGCTFIGNTAKGNGGGVSFGGADLGELANCRFVGNTAVDGGGGGLSSMGRVCVATNNVFVDNIATADGGGILCGAGTGTLGVMADCVFAGNESSVGGGVYISGSVDLASSCVFSNNCAQSDGGALNVGTLGVATNCTFRDNVAKQYGGGLFCRTLSGTAAGCLFDNNTNGWSNSGSQVRKVRQVAGCTFTGWGDMQANSYDRCVFDGCKFHYYSWDDGMVCFNSTTGAGHIRNCIFRNCDTHTLIENVTAAQTLEISNCTFVDNARSDETIVLNGTPQPIAAYLIFAHRAGSAPEEEGGGAYPNTNIVSNCIFWNNTRNGERSDVNFYATEQRTVGGTKALNVVSNSIYGVRSGDGGRNPVTSAMSQVADPCFLGDNASFPGVPRHMIRRSSPAYDAGVEMDWMAGASDLAGTNRVLGAHVDIGCYECWLPRTGTVVVLR